MLKFILLTSSLLATTFLFSGCAVTPLKPVASFVQVYPDGTVEWTGKKHWSAEQLPRLLQRDLVPKESIVILMARDVPDAAVTNIVQKLKEAGYYKLKVWR